MTTYTPTCHRWSAPARYCAALVGWLVTCTLAHAQATTVPSTSIDSEAKATEAAAPLDSPALATFGGGCFWCVEAVFENVDGVLNVVSGYAGGSIPNPTYEMVKTGRTGHAEVCQITFDPNKVSYLKLLEVFLKTHDPTTLNRQGPDLGTQYRSAIFYHDDQQKLAAEELIASLDQSKAFRSKIVTKLEPLTMFYLAEEYHQDYYLKHPGEAYCRLYVRPKVAKVKKVIQELERKEKLKEAKDQAAGQ